MAAGVHHTDLLAVIGSAHDRREVEPGLLDHGQRIHVGAQRHDRPRQPTHEYAYDAGMSYVGAHFVEAQAAQMLGHQRRGSELAIAEFRISMNVAPPSDNPVFQRCRPFVDICPAR